MKTIEIDDDLYQYIASQTQHIGESASSILRRLLVGNLSNEPATAVITQTSNTQTTQTDFSMIMDLINRVSFSREKKSVNRFLAILSALYACNSTRFSLAATSLHGSKRRYLATSEAALLEHGKNTKPKSISGTPYWVVTNNNTARKSYIIESIMKNMAIPQQILDEVTARFVAKSGA